MSLDDYLELCAAFAPAREEFALMVRQLSQEYRLDRITNPIAFRKQFDELCLSVGANIEKARGSRISKSIKDWVPMIISTLIAIAKALGIAHFPDVMTPFLEFVATAIPIAPSKEGNIRYPKVYRHLAEAQSKCAAAEWASAKSFRPKAEQDQPPDDNFHGQVRRNDTHQSTTDGDARLMRKGNGKEARLSFGAHALMDGRHGLCADLSVTLATESEPRAAVAMLERQRRLRHKPAARPPTKAITVAVWSTGAANISSHLTSPP
jgi:hypothetical protein